jgi:hypothetical protein
MAGNLTRLIHASTLNQHSEHTFETHVWKRKKWQIKSGWEYDGFYSVTSTINYQHSVVAWDDIPLQGKLDWFFLAYQHWLIVG